MVDYAAHRAKFEKRLRDIRNQREQPKQTKPTCTHEWQRFRQSISTVSEWPRFKGVGAYFVVLGCVKCHEKRTVDYVVQR